MIDTAAADYNSKVGNKSWRMTGELKKMMCNLFRFGPKLVCSVLSFDCSNFGAIPFGYNNALSRMQQKLILPPLKLLTAGFRRRDGRNWLCIFLSIRSQRQPFQCPFWQQMDCCQAAKDAQNGQLKRVWLWQSPKNLCACGSLAWSATSNAMQLRKHLPKSRQLLFAVCCWFQSALWLW